MLLTADLHLDDREVNGYRWGVFTAIEQWVKEQPNQAVVIIAGDLGDKKDRHSARFVNRLVEELDHLVGMGVVFHITCGNHDAPISGIPYWNMLNGRKGVHFYTKPTKLGALLLLPYADDPAKEWAGLDWAGVRCAILHQTVTGVIGNNGHKLENAKMPPLPRGIKYYAGDIHDPQLVGRVQYIGSPHPINYGDTYPCRMLEIDANSFEITKIIPMAAIKKHVVEYRGGGEAFSTEGIRMGDQVKVRIVIPIERLAEWPAEEAHIREQLSIAGVTVASLEPIVEGEPTEHGAINNLTEPAAILQEFIAANDVPADIAPVGIELLQKALA
jgi:DNA repair exonuclease SbcCD nuclease subunit